MATNPQIMNDSIGGKIYLQPLGKGSFMIDCLDQKKGNITTAGPFKFEDLRAVLNAMDPQSES